MRLGEDQSGRNRNVFRFMLPPGLSYQSSNGRKCRWLSPTTRYSADSLFNQCSWRRFVVSYIPSASYGCHVIPCSNERCESIHAYLRRLFHHAQNGMPWRLRPLSEALPPSIAGLLLLYFLFFRYNISQEDLVQRYYQQEPASHIFTSFALHSMHIVSDCFT